MHAGLDGFLQSARLGTVGPGSRRHHSRAHTILSRLSRMSAFRVAQPHLHPGPWARWRGLAAACRCPRCWPCQRRDHSLLAAVNLLGPLPYWPDFRCPQLAGFGYPPKSPPPGSAALATTLSWRRSCSSDARSCWPSICQDSFQSIVPTVRQNCRDGGFSSSCRRQLTPFPLSKFSKPPLSVLGAGVHIERSCRSDRLTCREKTFYSDERIVEKPPDHEGWLG